MYGYSTLDGLYWNRGPSDDMPRYVELGNDWVYDHVRRRNLRLSALEQLYSDMGLTLAEGEVGPAPAWYEEASGLPGVSSQTFKDVMWYSIMDVVLEVRGYGTPTMTITVTGSKADNGGEIDLVNLTVAGTPVETFPTIAVAVGPVSPATVAADLSAALDGLMAGTDVVSADASGAVVTLTATGSKNLDNLNFSVSATQAQAEEPEPECDPEEEPE